MPYSSIAHLLWAFFPTLPSLLFFEETMDLFWGNISHSEDASRLFVSSIDHKNSRDSGEMEDNSVLMPLKALTSDFGDSK